MTTPRILVSLACLALSVPLLSGCGAGEATGIDVADAAAATRDKGTARMKMTMRMSGMGLPSAVVVPAEGVTSLGEPRAEFTMDFGALVQMAGGDLDGKVRIRFDGADVYVDPPRIPGVKLPGGGGWIGFDAKQLVEAMGIDADAAGALFTVDPASQLRALQSAGELKEDGGEEIDGVETTRYTGAYSANDLVDTLPPAERAEVRKALEQLAKVSGDDAVLTQETPVELWADEDSVVRRMRMSTRVPGQGGQPAGKMDMTYELSDFGAKLDVSEPKGVTDVTDMILRMLRSMPAGAGAATAG